MPRPVVTLTPVRPKSWNKMLCKAYSGKHTIFCLLLAPWPWPMEILIVRELVSIGNEVGPACT